MIIRSARLEDRPAARALAARLGLDYPEMEDDPFWVAEDGGRIVGLVGLKRHADCLELVGLGVEPDRRSGGTGRPGSSRPWPPWRTAIVYLATIIPDFFARLRIPARRRRTRPAWPRIRPGAKAVPGIGCTVMVRRRTMSLPVFPEFKPLELEDRDELLPYFERYPLEISESTFANHFIWRRFDHPRLHHDPRQPLLLLRAARSSRPIFSSRSAINDIPETLRDLPDRGAPPVPHPRLLRRALVRRPPLRARPGRFRLCLPDRGSDRAQGQEIRRQAEPDQEVRKIPRLALRPRSEPADLAPAGALFEEWLADKGADGGAIDAQKDAIQEALLHFEDAGPDRRRHR